jgi:DNA-binding CsgD family transcriptional regulator
MSHLTVGTKNDYRTDCKICHLGIYNGQPTAWGRGLVLGLVHAACAPDLTPLRPSAPAEPARPGRPAQGGVLTDRQIVLVQHLADGSTVQQIAEREHVTTQSVYNQLRAACIRIGADDHAELITLARRAGLITKGTAL